MTDVAPTNRVEVEDDELAAKGCLRWNTDKYQVGIFGCDTPNCNKDLDQGDCAHVCEENEARVKKPKVKQQVLNRDTILRRMCYSFYLFRNPTTLCHPCAGVAPARKTEI